MNVYFNCRQRFLVLCILSSSHLFVLFNGRQHHIIQASIDTTFGGLNITRISFEHDSNIDFCVPYEIGSGAYPIHYCNVLFQKVPAARD